MPGFVVVAVYSPKCVYYIAYEKLMESGVIALLSSDLHDLTHCMQLDNVDQILNSQKRPHKFYEFLREKWERDTET